jgi:hypothetical protein
MAVGMVLAVPWHILGDPNSPFPKAASQLWGGEVSWRTALAYDAATGANCWLFSGIPAVVVFNKRFQHQTFLPQVPLEIFGFYHQAIAIGQYSW